MSAPVPTPNAKAKPNAPGAPRMDASATGRAPWRLAYGATPLRSDEAPDAASAGAPATRFRVWAPRAREVAVVFPGHDGRTVPLTQTGEGVFEATVAGSAAAGPAAVPGLGAGSDYAYSLDGGPPLPDPVSRWQPAGVHGPSRVVDPEAHAWSDAGWRGLPLERLVIYELHVGTFTPEGTFDAAIAKLDDLAALGVTAIEPMPIAEFPGGRNWGYDGVHLYAPQSSYGGPAGFKRLVDACHARGLAVILDVVYNHLGPEGNYLGAFGPYFSDRYRTPWGEALNFDDRDCDPVRRDFIDNALYWLSEYHVDGLRLDAIHGIFDFGARHLLAEMSDAFHAQAAALGREACLIAESDLNDVRVIAPREAGGWGLDAQWSDDFHHAQHTLLTGARQGYFADFGRMADLGKALERGFVYDGAWSRYRRRRHGNDTAGRPGRQFVVSVQNHDQVANASVGRRLGTLTDPARERLAAALLLCAPNVPLLFMGQEFGARTPFHYFTSHGDAALARAVTEGRRAEMAALQGGTEFADPQAEATFAACRLDWAERERPPHAGVLRWYGDLLRLRRAHACLHDCDRERTRAEADEDARWLVLRRGDPARGSAGGAALLVANYSAQAQAVPLPATLREAAAWQRVLWSGDAAYGADEAHGSGAPPERIAATAAGMEATVPLGPWQAVLYLSATQGV